MNGLELRQLELLQSIDTNLAIIIQMLLFAGVCILLLVIYWFFNNFFRGI